MKKYLVFCFFEAIDERDSSVRDEKFVMKILDLDLWEIPSVKDHMRDLLNKDFFGEFGEEIITVDQKFTFAAELSLDIEKVELDTISSCCKIYAELTEYIWQEIASYISDHDLKNLAGKATCELLRSFTEEEDLKRKKAKGFSN